MFFFMSLVLIKLCVLDLLPAAAPQERQVRAWLIWFDRETLGPSRASVIQRLSSGLPTSTGRMYNIDGAAAFPQEAGRGGHRQPI